MNTLSLLNKSILPIQLTHLRFGHFEFFKPETKTQQVQAPVTKCCDNDICPNHSKELRIPGELIDSSGQIKPQYHHKDHDGFYVSPMGNVYCCRQCWAEYCGD